MRIRAAWLLAFVALLAVLPLPKVGAQSAQFDQFLHQPNTFTGTQTFKNVVVNGTCTGCGTANAITALTGGVTASGPGSAVATVAAAAWSVITGTPTTLAGYGITNGVANTLTVAGHALSSNVSIAFSDLTGALGYSSLTGQPSLPTTTYYLCAKGAAGTCVYNGDGGTTATPSDANNCTTKATPCLTLAGVSAYMTGHVLTGIVTIQLADTAGTGTDCYRPSNVIFDEPAMGGGTPFFSIYGAANPLTDVYPTVYIFIQGNTTTKTNVKFNGSGSCTGTTSSTGTAFSFKGTEARVRGIEVDYYKGGEIECDSHCDIWAEDLSATSDNPTNTMLVQAYWGSHISMGGSWSVTNLGGIQVNFASEGVTCTPLSCVTLAWSNSGGGNAALHANEDSEIHIQGGTYTFGVGTGGGAIAMQAQMFSGIATNATTNAVVSMTFNDSTLTELVATQFSYIAEACGAANFTCTFTSLGFRADSETGSLVQYRGTSAADSASTTQQNGCIAQNSSGAYLPNVCANTFNSLGLGPNASANILTLKAPNQASAQTMNWPATRQTETVGVYHLPIDGIFAAPAGTTSTTFVMLGLGNGGSPNALITPQVSGTIMVDITGTVLNSTIADGCTAKVVWNTGAAPANGAAPAGTVVGSTKAFVASTAAGQQGAAFGTMITGLTLGTQIYVDLQFEAVTGGTCTFKGMEALLWER